MEKLIKRFETICNLSSSTNFTATECVEEAKKIAIKFAIQFWAENTEVKVIKYNNGVILDKT